jgi:hypothetical protein
VLLASLVAQLVALPRLCVAQVLKQRLLRYGGLSHPAHLPYRRRVARYSSLGSAGSLL